MATLSPSQYESLRKYSSEQSILNTEVQMKGLFVCLFVYLFVCLFVCLFVYLFVCLFVCLYIYWYVCLYIAFSECTLTNRIVAFIAQ